MAVLAYVDAMHWSSLALLALETLVVVASGNEASTRQRSSLIRAASAGKQVPAEKTRRDSSSTTKSVVVTVTPPAAGESRAVLHVNAKPADGSGYPIRVRAGSREFDVSPSETLDVPVLASPTVLQRIDYLGGTFLIRIRPESRVQFHDHPCGGPRITAEWLKSGLAKKDRAYCAHGKTACRSGYEEADAPGLAEDPLCPFSSNESVDVTRCVALAKVRILGTSDGIAVLSTGRLRDEAPQTVRVKKGVQTDWIPVRWIGPCFEPELTFGNQTVHLAIGPGESWTVRIGKDRISGTAEPDFIPTRD